MFLYSVLRLQDRVVYITALPDDKDTKGRGYPSDAIGQALGLGYPAYGYNDGILEKAYKSFKQRFNVPVVYIFDTEQNDKVSYWSVVISQ